MPLPLHPGVAESLRILRLQDGLAGRARPDMEDVYRRVIGVLERSGSAFAVVGAHAVNVHGRPRATGDIDIVVEGQKLDVILRALGEEFGALEHIDLGVVVRVVTLSVDLIRGDNHPLLRCALDEARDIQGIRVPPPELLVALKFMAAISPWRDIADRQQDVADLVRVYRSTGAEFDRSKALAHGARVYPGAERELGAMLDRIDRGEPVAL